VAAMPTVRKVTLEEVRSHWKVKEPVNSSTSTRSKHMVSLPHNVERVLLLHPPIVDIRVPWVRYLQPARLLRLATFFRSVNADVRVVDTVALSDGKPLRKARVRQRDIEGHPINVWRFGMTPHAIEKALRALRREKWVPDIVYVESHTTFWWEGVAEVIRTLKSVFPDSKVVLLGPYAELTELHARSETLADEIGHIDWSQLSDLTPDLSHYDTKPDAIYLSLNAGQRDPQAVVAEIDALRRKYNIQSFAFLDHGIAGDCADTLRQVLEGVLSGNLSVRFSALGNLPMRDLLAYPDLAGLMKRSGYTRIVFGDDRSASPGAAADQLLLEEAEEVSAMCSSAGFQLRTDAVTGSLCLGQPGETLEQRAKTATLLAHHLGSIIFWPYQPVPDELPTTDLENQNGKLFPMRQVNGATFNDYLGVLGLASVLNAKYRTTTFNFLGESIIARLFRESIDRQAWIPPEEVKGTLKLPAVKK